MTVLVLDIGTSSIRAMLFDDNAQLIPGAVTVYKQQLNTEPDGAATLAMSELQHHVEDCIDRILQHPQAINIQCVGMDTLVGNMVGIDAQQKPITPVYTYADTRDAEDVHLLRSMTDSERVHQQTGCLLHSAYHPARLHWLKRISPTTFAQVDQWVDLGTFLYQQWFGRTACSYSVASWTGLLNRTTLKWDSNWLEFLGLPETALPGLSDYDTPLVGLIPAYRTRWPALANIPFFLAVGDGAAANVGAGCVQYPQLALTVGTTAALRMITDQPLAVIPQGLWSYRVNRNLHLVGGATSEGGNIFRWAYDTLRIDPATNIETALAQRTPDEHGLVFLPLLAGERSPGWAANAVGSVFGLRLSTTPLDLLQAALEGVAHRLALITEQIQQAANTRFQITASGGALVSSPVWTQIIANALDYPLQITNETELTARGTAILALHALGQCKLHDHPPTITTTIHPQPQTVGILRTARERQQQIYRLFYAHEQRS